MLYDPKWEKTETKIDPLTLRALIAWLEKQPPEKIYCYGDTGRCLAAQYNQSLGRAYLPILLLGWRGDCLKFDYDLEEIALTEPHTFGAALERARAALR
jgi:hypothetical protein